MYEGKRPSLINLWVLCLYKVGREIKKIYTKGDRKGSVSQMKITSKYFKEMVSLKYSPLNGGEMNTDCQLFFKKKTIFCRVNFFR